MTQPSAEQQPTSTRLRQLILNVLTGRAVCPAPRPVDEATSLLDAHQAEVRTAVLREAADAIDATFTGPDRDRYARYGADLLRRMAEEGR
ncbi:hypothetical protein GCM10010363_07850 [Streptomyces omiyaensis]|uniref:hypothetical protein n=1 Tax=Streptomyces omiyaensis TaxID=68247 RepID=UPI0016793250|nr:hypothetical protein [Streptomyces omiyaensis]GGY29807.1 hypothetical protein GCM10010363_07850 [Streptomyces omiyaensis]